MDNHLENPTGRAPVGTQYGSHTYLWPFGIEFTGFGGILKGVGEFGKLDVGGGAVGVEDVIVGIKSNSLSVKGHRGLEIPRLARRVALSDFLEEECFRPAALPLTINLQLWGTKGTSEGRGKTKVKEQRRGGEGNRKIMGEGKGDMGEEADGE